MEPKKTYYTETRYVYLDRIKAADGSYAYTDPKVASLAGTMSKPGRIKAYNFNANIPAGSRINSITVEWKNKVTSPSGTCTGLIKIPSVKVNLMGNSTVEGKVKTLIGPVSCSSPNVWSLSWTASELGLTQSQLLSLVNSSSFGVYLNPQRNTNYNAGYYHVDYVKVTIDYSTPSWSLDVSSTVGSSNNKRNITVTLKDNNGVATSGTYTVNINLASGLAIDSVTSVNGTFSGSVWEAEIQSNSIATLQFVVKTETTGNYSVSAACNIDAETSLSDSDSFSLTYTPPGVEGLVPIYSGSESDEYTILPYNVSGYGTSFQIQNTSASAVSCTVEHPTIDYESYTVTNGSFSTSNGTGTWTINANSTSTLTLNYKLTGKRFIKVRKDATVLFRRHLVYYDYYEPSYGYVEFPVGTTGSGNYTFKMLVKAETSVSYPHLKVVAPGCGYYVDIIDNDGNSIAKKAFGGYEIYTDWTEVDLSFTITKGVSKVRIYGMASYADWDKSKYTLYLLTPVLWDDDNGVQVAGGCSLYNTDTGFEALLNGGTKTNTYAFSLKSLSGLSSMNLYGVEISFDYTVTAENPVFLEVMSKKEGEIKYVKSYKLSGAGNLRIGGPGAFFGFEEELYTALTSGKINMAFSNPYKTPARVNISNVKFNIYYWPKIDGDGFTFKSKHSSQLNVVLSSAKISFGEKRDVKLYDAQNTDVKLVSSWSSKPKSLELQLVIVGETVDEIQALSRRVSEWLTTDFWKDGNVDYGKLVFDTDPSIEYHVIMDTPLDISLKEAQTYAEATAKFTVLEVVNTDSGVGGAFGQIEGVRLVRPTIIIQCTGGPVEILESVNNQKLMLSGEWGDGTELTIDCRRRRVYDSNGKLLNGVVDLESDWFELKGAYDFSKSRGCVIKEVSFIEYY